MPSRERRYSKRLDETMEDEKIKTTVAAAILALTAALACVGALL